MTPIHLLALLLYGFIMCAIGAVLGLRSVFWESGAK